MAYRSYRYPTTFPVELQQGSLVQKCYLIDITSTGAGIFEVTGLNPKDEVMLRCSFGNLKATVQWADDDQCGLVFHQQIGTRQLQQFIYAPTTFGIGNRTTHAFRELR